jgi:hypothetical protein
MIQSEIQVKCSTCGQQRCFWVPYDQVRGSYVLLRNLRELTDGEYAAVVFEEGELRKQYSDGIAHLCRSCLAGHNGRYIAFGQPVLEPK